MSTPFRSMDQALRWYLQHAPKTCSVPSVDGAHLTRTARLNGAGDVVEELFVPTPHVDGGAGSFNEQRLCGVIDVEACLPTDEADRLMLLVRACYPVRVALRVLAELTASKWHNERYYNRYNNVRHDVLHKMRCRGLVPAPEARQNKISGGTRTLRA